MKKILFAIAGCAILGLTSCDMDVNENPNAISSVTNDNIFPTAEMNLAATMGVGFNMYGGYCAEIYGQNAGCSNYLKYSQFEVTASNTGSSYTQLYSRVLQQLEVVRQQSADEPGSYLAATVLRAYTFQILVDAYGEVPYKEALTDNTQPKYDSGDTIYAGIIKELVEAKAKANNNSTVCANLTFGKTTAQQTTAKQWIQFANSLLLKLYMRESAVVDVNSNIKALIDENNFITDDVVYDQCWANASGSYSPLFQEHKTIAADLTLNYAVTATYKAEGVNDNRLTANWTAGTKGMIGTVSGTNLSSEMSGTTNAEFAAPNYTFDMPVYLMTVADVDFFLAEYYAKNNNHSSAEKYYKAAISRSFEMLGVTDVTDGVTSGEDAYPYVAADYKKCIGIQKWMFNAAILNGFEGWVEVRRLGYPTFSDQSAQNIISADLSSFNELPKFYEAGTLYTPKNVYNPVGSKKLRERFDYASTSTDYNNNVPATKDPTTPVFWKK